MHPSISLVTSKKQQLFFEDILYFEKIDNQTRYDILNEQYGVRIVNQSDSNISNNVSLVNKDAVTSRGTATSQ